MAEVSTSPFVMHGARDAVTGGLVHIEQQMRALEMAVFENPGLAFDLAKTLIESVCRTVLSERAIAFSETDDLPRLFKTVSTYLPFLPPGATETAGSRKSIKQTLNGLHTAIQGICELRNQFGFASHGTATPRPTMESVQALLAAKAADTIVGFLYSIHSQDRVRSPSPKALYDSNPEFNDSVDEANGAIRIYEAEFRPSEVLFQMEPETYRVYLAEFNAEVEDSDGGKEVEAGEISL